MAELNKLTSACDWQYILNNIASNCFEVATSKTGCCVMQLCVEKSLGRPRQILVSEIIATAGHLAEHPFGSVNTPCFLLLYIIMVRELTFFFFCFLLLAIMSCNICWVWRNQISPAVLWDNFKEVLCLSPVINMGAMLLRNVWLNPAESNAQEL